MHGEAKESYGGGDNWVASVNNLYYYSTEEALSAIKNATGTAEIKIGPGATNDDFKGDYAGSTLHWYNLSEGIIGTSADALRIDMSEATSMTAILGYAFIGCSKITSLILPPNITSLGRQSFQGCGGITTLTIPDGVTFLDWATLCDCSALTAITIPASVTTIADLALWNAGVTSITFAVTIGWHTRTNGTACDVSNPATNAANLKSNTHAWGTEGMKR